MTFEHPIVQSALDHINAQVKVMMQPITTQDGRAVAACEDGTVCEGGQTIGKWCVQNGSLRIDLNHT